MSPSLIIRRTHMYLALFLAPWMLIYALSTMAMNHRQAFREYYGGDLEAWEPERETQFDGTFPEDASSRMVAEQILSALEMEGSYFVRKDGESGRYIIYRNFPIIPKRITFDPASGNLSIDRQEFRTPVFLEEMHRRRGYRAGLILENAWAVSVDLVIIAMVFRVASGLWMWWELRAARKWGAIFGIAGMALFVLFLVTI